MPADPVLSAVSTAVSSGGEVSAAIEQVAESAANGSAWRALGAAWRVATVCGAPLAAALRAFAEALRDREAARRDIEVALAGPRATARIVMLLPLIAVLLGLLMGVDLVATLSTPIGAACIAGRRSADRGREALDAAAAARRRAARVERRARARSARGRRVRRRLARIGRRARDARTREGGAAGRVGRPRRTGAALAPHGCSTRRTRPHRSRRGARP